MSEVTDKHVQKSVSSEASPASLELVKHVLKSLAKYVSGKKIYAENNPVLTKFAAEFHDSFGEFFKKEDELILMIEQSSIKWLGEIVYENDKREDSLAFLLFRDGVGEVAIAKDVPGEELDQFTGILTEEFHNFSAEQDIVTKLWKADFRFITYRVLEDYLSGECGGGEWKEREDQNSLRDFADHEENRPSLEDKGRIIVEPNDPIESIDTYMKKLVKRVCPSGDEAELEAAFQNILESLLNVSTAELNLCQEELRVENGSEALVVFMDAILDFTMMFENPKAVRDVVNVNNRIIDFIVGERRVGALTKALELVREFKLKHSVPESLPLILKDFEERLSGDSLISALMDDIQKWNKRSPEILEYFTLIGKKTIAHLCQILPKIEDRKVHKEICNTLVSVAGKNIETVLDSLDIDNADIALDVVYILRGAGHKKISPKIRELIHYPDSRVKVEILVYLGILDGDEANSLLLKALDDPDKNIRMKSLEILQEKQSLLVLEKISDLAFSKDLSNRSLDEQEAVFKTLGRIGNEETVKRIGKMVEKKRILHLGKNRENKFLAIGALEYIRNKSSLTLLETLAKDSNSLVQSRAERAWKNLKNLMEQPV